MPELREIAKRKQFFIVGGSLGVIGLFQILSIVNVFRDVRPGVVCSAVLAFLIVATASRFLSILFHRLNTLFIAFLVVQLFSILNYAVNPLVLRYIESHPETLPMVFSYLIIPCVFFYTAGVAIGGDRALTKQTLNFVALTALFCIASGILLQLTIPTFYVQYLLRILSNNVSLLPRMSGYLGISMLMGAICATSVPLVWKIPTTVERRVLGVAICVAGSFLTLQRGSMTATLFVIASILVYSLRRHGVRAISGNSRPIGVLAIVFLAIGTLLTDRIVELQQRFSVLGPEITSRAISFDSMINERSFQWEAVREVLGEYPLGLGIGMMSHVTAAAGFPLAIPDGNYFRILGELGPQGFTVFIALLVMTLLRAIRHKKMEVMLAILAYMLMAVGTNVFDFYYSGFVFWLLVGIAQSQYVSPKPERAFTPA